MPVSAQGLRLEKLCDAFVQPGRAPSTGKLRNERVRQFVLQNVCQFWRHGIQTADRDTQLAVIDSSRPGRRLSDIEERLLGVESDNNVVARRVAEIARQIIIIG